MKKLHTAITVFAASVLLISSCTKSSTTPTPTPTPTPAIGKFTATLGADAFSAPDAYIMPAFGGTIAVMAKDAKGRTFSIAIFEKDFPLNKPVNVSYSPSISYANERAITYIAKSGTMTITAYGKSSAGAVNNLRGSFAITLTSDGTDIEVKDGNFDVSTK